MPSTTIRILLSYTKWDQVELLSKLTEQNPKIRADFFAKAKVIDPLLKEAVVGKSPQKKCAMCFTECIQKVRLKSVQSTYII